MRSASFLGTSGELGPTLIASVDCVWVWPKLAGSVFNDTSGDGVEVLPSAIVRMSVKAWGLGSCDSELSVP